MKSGWVTKKLGEVCEVVLGGTPRTSVPEYWGGSVPWLTPGDMGKIQGLYVDKTSRTLTQKGLENGSSLFPANSVVLSTRAPIGYVLINSVPMCTNQGCKTIVPDSAIMPKFLAYNLIGRAIELNELGTGTTFKELATGVLKNIDLPIPPLAEQKRIVAKIDAAFEKIDALKANAEKNLANAKELFQSALDEAMRPKKGWVEKRLGDVGSCKNGLNFKRESEGEKIDIVGVGDFKKGLVVDDTTELERLTLQELPEQEWYLHPNDIVFVRSNGSKALVGRAVIIKSKRPLTFSGFCIRYRIEDKCIDPDYLARVVSVESFRKAMLSGRNASTINNVTQPILLSQVINIPSLAEQKQIVKRLDSLTKKIQLLEQNYARQMADCAEMRQAILREAFEGRL